MKTNLKSVRLTDRECKYIEDYRGESFSEKLSNMIHDVVERQENLVQQWNRTQAEIDERRAELWRITEQVQMTRRVNVKLGPLVDAVIALLSKE